MDPEIPKLTKVFLGGIKDLTKADITEHFSRFGEFSKDIDLVNDSATGNPKFAFLQFKNVPDCDNCIKSNPHQVKGTNLYARLAVNRDLNNELRQVEKAMKNNPQGGRLKVFIGGLPPQADEEMIRKALAEHVAGINVTKAVIKKNRDTNKPRGFGFLTLDHDHDVHKACEIRHFVIDGKKVECKLAPDSSINVGGQAGGFRGGRGGGSDRGGGFGGRGRGGRGGSSGGWQSEGYGSSSGYGAGYDSWGGETYDDGSSGYQAAATDYSGYSQNGNGYDNYDYSSYSQPSYDYYGSGDTSGYGQSSGGGGYGGGRGAGRGRGASSSGGYSAGRGAGRGARGGGRGAARPHPYQQSY